MKIKIPENLTADMPQTFWGKVLSATPVVMTVIATMLAGLASSEMTRAQYVRSLAAQQQSKAGDQWSFFQAKRLRGAIQRNTLDLLRNTTEVRPFDLSAAAKSSAELQALIESPGGQQAMTALQQGRLPSLGPELTIDAKVKAALEAMESSKTEEEIKPTIAQLNDKVVDDSLRSAKDRARAFDDALKPVNQAVDLIEAALTKRAGLQQETAGSSSAAPSVNRDFTVARLQYTALRYDAEARLNQAIANVYELQVRRNNLSAQRHHTRSQRFFYGMLGAQMAVIIATFAMAARQRSLLWSLAAAAGAAAVSFAVYVFLFV